MEGTFLFFLMFLLTNNNMEEYELNIQNAHRLPDKIFLLLKMLGL